MFHFFAHYFRKRKMSRRPVREIDPDEIFLDSQNLPAFDRHQFEGRLEKPISGRVILTVGAVFAALLLLMLGKTFALQIALGSRFAKQAESNRLRHTLIFGDRGVITDTRGEFLAWNAKDSTDSAFSRRVYTSRSGFAHLLGFVKYPSKDKAGFYYKVDFEGMDGVEKYWSEYIVPEHGLKIVETDALGAVLSDSILKRPNEGKSIRLSLDARLEEKLHDFIGSLAKERGFVGGAGVLMDVRTGELLAQTSFPEYDSQALTDGSDGKRIQAFVSDPRKPFLNRATAGLYTPGSIVKPIIALAALEEGIITPEKKIVSTGALTLQNPFNPSKPSVFRDWKAHGAVDMRKALAVSSDVYFYNIGGGVPPEKDAPGERGLGIENIEKYLRLFGFGAPPGENDFFGAAGVIPNPVWKAENFDGDAWRIGDTYHTAIGQYGLQVTPLQAARAVAAIANGGKLLAPRLVHEASEAPKYSVIPVKPSSFEVIRRGMRDAVSGGGTASGLSLPGVSVAAKTGTAELGTRKKYVNSWIVGFFPYEQPRFAFTILMERGPHENTIGALYVMRELLEWMQVYTPEYLQPTSNN